MTRRRIDTQAIGSVVVPVYVPRGTGRTGGLVLKPTRVLFHAGETAADAEAFAAALRESVEAYRAAHPLQPATGLHADGTAGRSQHYGGTADVRRLRDDRGLDALVARYRASRGIVEPEPVAKPKPARKPRAPKVAPVVELTAPEPVAPVAPDQCWYYLRTAGKPPERCALVDGHEPHDAPRGGGHLYPSLAAEPVAEPEPEPAPVVQAEPVALPVVVALPAPRERPTCPRCGQSFRLSGSGFAWHMANRPDCAAKRQPAQAA